ncbi:MAG: excinuclease ABC subunit UvrB [bacterium]|nr:excinuclease ABC subunit UvrB [bacterium]
MSIFNLQTTHRPQGDQPRAISALTGGAKEAMKYQTLLGVTGSGKTFTIANVIANLNRPTLVISHNKTLAAQLYAEFKDFLPDNAVEYFVSFYDYYQPEAYIPQADVYIEKDSAINNEIDRLRLSATRALMERRDVIIVASVSCIYGLGSPKDYRELLCDIKRGKEYPRQEILEKLVNIQYERNDYDFKRGTFRVRGDSIEIFPAYEEEAVRVELFGDEVERIRRINPLTGETLGEKERQLIYPAKHFVTTRDQIEIALQSIKKELDARTVELKSKNKLVEAQRLRTRTIYDLEMLQEVGYCQGIENYSRHLAGRAPGERPSTLLDYFPRDYLLIIDESHVSLPQLRAMYEGDRARKQCLVDYGFRLPSAMDNRPLKFDEFESLTDQVIYVSATPGHYELEHSSQVVEQIIRPTGLMDPVIHVKPTTDQIPDMIKEIKQRVQRQERVLVTTLTKRMAEDLAEYLHGEGIKVRYLHSEINTLARVEILRDLRLAEFDCLVGINLLREGLDLPEVSLVAILDADREGFLRSESSLIQIAGRCARNVGAEVIMYADTITGSMKRAIEETERRRRIQEQYNLEYGITPTTIKKAISYSLTPVPAGAVKEEKKEYQAKDLPALLADLKQQMTEAAADLEFEKAASLRDEILRLKES